MTPVLEVANLAVRFGASDVLSDVSFALGPGSVTGLIGPNGAGKTTLIDSITGFVVPRTGRVVFAGGDITGLPPHARARAGLGRTFQSLELFEDLSVAENILVASEAGAGGPGAAARASAVAGIAGVEAYAGRRPSSLPHADRKAVALARALAGQPQVLLLDEPAAGLDPEGRRQLGRSLAALAGAGTAVLLVDHDLAFMLAVCDRVLVLDLGRVIADGTPDAVRADHRVAELLGGRLRSAGPSARPPSPAVPPTIATASRAPTSSTGATSLPDALRLESVTAGYAGMPVVTGLDLRVAPGEVVALLGPNGAGKTTTLLTASGVLAPLAGSVIALGAPVGRRLHVAARRGVSHVMQSGGIFAGLSAAENLRLAGRKPQVQAAIARFPSLHPVLSRPAGQLSGGEQRTLALARALVSRPRLLLIDELSLGLSSSILADLLETLARLASEEGTAVLFAEQHAELALQVASRAYILVAGRLVLEAPAADLLRRPETLEAAYLGNSPRRSVRNEPGSQRRPPSRYS